MNIDSQKNETSEPQTILISWNTRLREASELQTELLTKIHIQLNKLHVDNDGETVPKEKAQSPRVDTFVNSLSLLTSSFEENNSSLRQILDRLNELI